MKEVNISYELTEKEFVRHRLRKFFLHPRAFIFLFFLIFIVLFEPLSEILFSEVYISDDDNPGLLLSLIPLFIVPLLVVLAFGYGLKKAYNSNPDFSSTIHIGITWTGYEGKSVNTEVKKNWSSIHQIKKEGKMLDIYFDKRAFASVPLKCIEPNQLIDIEKILVHNKVKNNL